MINDNEFCCKMCKGVFVKGRLDEEAWAEHLERNPEVTNPEDCDMICEECFKLNQFLVDKFKTDEEALKEYCDTVMRITRNVMRKYLKRLIKIKGARNESIRSRGRETR